MRATHWKSWLVSESPHNRIIHLINLDHGNINSNLFNALFLSIRVPPEIKRYFRKSLCYKREKLQETRKFKKQGTWRKYKNIASRNIFLKANSIVCMLRKIKNKRSILSIKQDKIIEQELTDIKNRMGFLKIKKKQTKL